MAKSKRVPPPMGKTDSKRDSAPAVMIMIGLKPGSDRDDMMGAPKPKPSMRGKVPGFGGKTRRTYTGS